MYDMRTKFILLSIILILAHSINSQQWIRINQLGYLPISNKTAVYISNQNIPLSGFTVCEAISGRIVYKSEPRMYDGSHWGMKTAARLDFSALEKAGAYYIQAGNAKSPTFRIDASVYAGTADFILQYMRQNRCGYNPYLNDSCHVHDGFIVDHPTLSGKIIDVKGGWHDATDYLQYATTSVNAIYQMLFAYQKNPEVYKDFYDASGRKGPNGIPDILDEALWGIEWMLKMNPDSGIFFNQIADDRDHAGFRLPNHDKVSYGNGLYRPVYFVTGKPQGLAKYKNRTTGVSSTVGKFASSFGIASRIFKNSHPELAKKLAVKAREAYHFGLVDMGTTQTASNKSPYFYEEDNYKDDLELGAWENYLLTNNDYYKKQAHYWGALEPVTPWMEKGTARHYQFYPFVNLGHANQAFAGHETSKTYIGFMKQGLQFIYDRAKNDVFLNGVPFIWCSNNLVAAAITQAKLYQEVSGDMAFAEMEAALRDWLFGCNPWGTSMICDLPLGGDSPVLPHSSLTVVLGVNTTGGLVDGPVYSEIYNNLIGIRLLNEDSYKEFQNGKAVYHDDIGDYSTNEPTMDGTASLSFYLSAMEKKGLSQKKEIKQDVELDKYGAIIRKGVERKSIYLIFSADTHGEGAETILDVLAKENIKASFFLTGNFLRNKKFGKSIVRMHKENHYVGAHSDKHLLYCPWEKRDSLLVDRSTFESDLRANYNELRKFSKLADSAIYYLAPYEWYNQVIREWTDNMGLKLVNFTPGNWHPG
jgi:endoglucanase